MSDARRQECFEIATRRAAGISSDAKDGAATMPSSVAVDSKRFFLFEASAAVSERFVSTTGVCAAGSAGPRGLAIDFAAWAIC